MKVEKFRDLTLLYQNEDTMMVIACDTCSAIGMKEGDVVKANEELVGYLTAGVVLIELLAFRAKPIILVNNFCIEMKPTGERIISGIQKAIIDCGLEKDIVFTGSTEENMPTSQTSIGVTGIGTIDLKTWIKPKTYKGDALFLIGRPKVGLEIVNSSDPFIIKMINNISNISGVNEILPVGSKGIDYEIGELCKSNKLEFNYRENVTVDVNKSAGPVTCILVSGQEEILINNFTEQDIEYYYLGDFS